MEGPIMERAKSLKRISTKAMANKFICEKVAEIKK